MGDGSVGFYLEMPTVLERMRQNPAADWTIEDVAALCRAYGVRFTPPTGGGSHYKVSAPGRREILTIPRARPVKPVYISKPVRWLAEGEEEDGG